MRKTLLIILLCLSQVAAGQDTYYVKNGIRFPIYFSKTKLLVRFKDATKSHELNNHTIAGNSILIERIHNIPDMAYFTFESSTTKKEFESTILNLRNEVNILSAHPMLVDADGTETAGLTDLVIARPKKEISEKDLSVILDQYGLRIALEDTDSQKNYYLSGQLVSRNPFEICEKLDASGLFEFTQPNCLRFIELAANPNDPLFASNWGLAKMKLPDAWNITTGCPGIKIAIIDDGVQLNHPDLQPNLLPGFDATPYGTSGGTVAGEQRHGTNCAGFAAAKGNNGTGIAGAAYNCKIIPIRAFGTKLNGDLRTETLDQYIATAINHAVNIKNADILSMSWGVVASATPINQDPVIIAALTNAAVNGRNGKGTIMVASSGNKGLNYLAPIPGNVGDVVIVGASNSSDMRWEGSNGPTHRIDVAAPGAYVTTHDVSTYINQPTESATSWAAPSVAGIAALVLSVNPNLTQLQVRKIIAESCDKVGGYNYIAGNGSTFPNLSHNNDLGYGRVNALKALEKAAGGPIAGPNLICINAGYTMTEFPAGSSAIWSASAGLSMTGNLASRQAGYNGTGTVYATLGIPNSCTPVTVKRAVWVGNPDLTKTINGLVAGTTAVNAGNLYNLAATTSSPSTTFNYNNYSGDGNIIIDLYSPNNPNTQMYVYSNSTNGSRKVKVTAANGCGSYAEDFVFYLQSGMLKAYPNPATDVLTLEFLMYEEKERFPDQVMLYSEHSLIPKKVISIREAFQQNTTSEGNKILIEVGDLPRGTYYLHVIKDNGKDEYVEKLRIELQ